MRKSADLFAFQVMFVLCMIWGLQQVAIKLVAADVAPIVQASLRSGLAALLLIIVILFKGGWQSTWKGTFKAGIVVGLFFTGEFLFIALGLQYTSAGHIAVFLYTGPVFTALGLHFGVAGERLKPLQWVGIGISLIGVLIAFGGDFNFATLDTQVLLGDTFGLLAGISLGATTVSIRASALSEAPASLTLLYQLISAFIILFIIALVAGQFKHFELTPIAVSSLLFQAVIVSFISFFTWFWLLRRYLASHLTVFSFMTPLFGVVFGMLLLSEKVSYNFIVGAVFILLGITLVSGLSFVSHLINKFAKH